ncbi:hypothetical protein FQA39_LY04425 [Lamprigera yunnana]|nr:hypothetical protein FQA39_LY04425 [Lamprigera yunnana]
MGQVAAANWPPGQLAVGTTVRRDNWPARQDDLEEFVKIIYFKCQVEETFESTCFQRRSQQQVDSSEERGVSVRNVKSVFTIYWLSLYLLKFPVYNLALAQVVNKDILNVNVTLECDLVERECQIPFSYNLLGRIAFSNMKVTILYMYDLVFDELKDSFDFNSHVGSENEDIIGPFGEGDKNNNGVTATLRRTPSSVVLAVPPISALDEDKRRTSREERGSVSVCPPAYPDDLERQ